MRLEDYDTRDRLTSTVVTNERITPQASAEDVREIVLDVERVGFEAAPGQSIGILAPGRLESGDEHHFRLYTVADLPEPAGKHVRVRLCVRRCNYVDLNSGEMCRGVASHYLCDLRPGDAVTLTGPYGLAFSVPPERYANMVLIGMGTGIAPFRAFVKHLSRKESGFEGRVWLFHGAQTGLEMLYRNRENDDLSHYLDRETFEAISVVSSRPHWSGEIDWSGALLSRGRELWRLLGEPNTYVYLAGLEPIREQLDDVFATIGGGKEGWTRRKTALTAGGRWVELLY